MTYKEHNTELIPVVGVHEEKCVNCHACISACPVKFCNDGSGNTVKVNANLCLACGSCIKACTHHARFYIDDFDSFITDLKDGQKMIAIVAPSVAASFPDKYLQLNGWLKSIGIEAIFDVSFGAELTVKSYMHYINKENPKTVIAQPCPALVTYIELYQPELLQHLAPADSPMLHTIKMVKRFYEKYKDYKVAVVSPCNAKKREFVETGFGDYNVAMKSLANYFEERNIDLMNFPATNFDNEPAERGVMFSTPGGLIQTAERWNPDIRYKSRKIEGPHIVYEYFGKLPENIEQNRSPFLIDCLNCDKGCNGGPLTLARDSSVDEIENLIYKRNVELQDYYKKQNANDQKLAKEKIEEILDKYWEDGLYERKYVNRWQNVKLKYPNEQELKQIYESMHKYTDADLFNCTSCGYGACKKMATAIFNGLNRPENCHFYLHKEDELSHKKIVEGKKHLNTILETSLDGFVQLDNDGLIVDANPAMRNILKKEDVIGRSLFDFLDKKNAEILHNQIKLREDNIQSSYELTFTNSEGGKVICKLSGTPLLDGEKRFGSFAMASDITQLKNIQAELQESNEVLEQRVAERTAELQEMVEELRTTTELIAESEQRQENILNFLPDPTFVIDRGQKVILWNKSMERLTGTKAEHILGKADGEYSVAIYDDNRKSLIDYVFLTEEEIKLINPDIQINHKTLSVEEYVESLNCGSHLYITASPLFDKNKNIIGAIQVTRDITEKKKAEIELKKLNIQLREQSIIMQEKNEELQQQSEEIQTQSDALMESENQLADIINFLPDATLVIDRAGKVIYWNRAMEILTGARADDMIGKGNYEYALPFYGERRPLLIDMILKPDIKIEDHYKHITKKDNTLIIENFAPKLNGGSYLFATASPLYDADQTIIGAIEIVRDISERKKAEQDLKHTHDKLVIQTEEILEKNVSLMEQQETIMAQNEVLNQQKEELIAQREALEQTLEQMSKQQAEIIQKNLLLEEQKEQILKKSIEFSELAETLKAQNEVIEDYNAELKKLTVIARETDNAIAILDVEGNIEWLNEGYTRLYGYTLQELTNEKGSNIMDISGNQHIYDILNRCITEKKSIIYQSLNISKTGEHLWTQTTLTPLLDEKGKVNNIVAIDSDVSKLKEAENEIRKQKEEIENQRDEIEAQRDIATQQADKIGRQNKSITDSIMYASRIQGALLPSLDNVRKIFPRSFVIFRPRDIVSGDFFWLKKKLNKIILAAADCTGHGVPGGFMSMLGISMLSEIINKSMESITGIEALDPAEVLNLLRENIVKTLHQKGRVGETADGMDIALCIFDTEKSIVEFAGANNSLFIFRKLENGEIPEEIIPSDENEKPKMKQFVNDAQTHVLFEYLADKMPIGIQGDMKRSLLTEFGKHTIPYKKGDSFYIFSDGYADQIGEESGRKFLIKHFRKLLFDVQDLSLDEQGRILEKTHIKFKGNADQVDDVLVIGVKM